MKELSPPGSFQLAHWTYTREEWKTFVRWSKKKKGFIYFAAHFFIPAWKPLTPEVRITHQKVSIGKDHSHFNGEDRTLERVHIRDEGQFNIMAIAYRDGNALNEIHFPVPKGKLKEAIEVEAELNRQMGR